MSETTTGRARRTGAPGPAEQLITESTATILVPQQLLDDYADMGDLLGKALRGEIQLIPPPAPRYHRCLICWLVSKLPGHGRCEHGRAAACDDCYDQGF